MKDFARFSGAENFYGAERGEFEARKRVDLRVRLRDGSRELRGGLHQQHAGKERLAGEMSAQERLLAAHGKFAAATFPGLEREQPIQETEFRTVRQMAESGGESVRHGLVHWWSA